MNISLADQQLILELLDVMSATKLQECRQHISAQLDGVVDFWLRHSHDAEYGYCSNTNHLRRHQCSTSDSDCFLGDSLPALGETGRFTMT